MENTSNETLIPFCQTITVNAPFIISTIVFFILSLISLFYQTILLFAIWKTNIFHVNIRYLFFNITATYLGTSVGFVIQALYNFNLFYYGFFISPNYIMCFMMRNIYSVCITMSVLFKVLLALERLYGSTKSQLKNQNDKPNSFVITVSVLFWVITIAVSIIRFVFNNKNNSTICYCDGAFLLDMYFYILFVASLITASILSYALFYYLLIRNRRIYTEFGINVASVHSLVERFQIWHNIQTMELMLAFMKLNVSFNLATCIFPLTALFLYRSYSYTMAIDLLQVFFIVSSVHNCLYPYICTKNNKRLKDKYNDIYDSINLKFRSFIYKNHTTNSVVSFAKSTTIKTQLSSHHLHFQLSPEEQNDIMMKGWLMSKENLKK